MHKHPSSPPPASAALLALGACNSEPETVNTYDAQAEALQECRAGRSCPLRSPHSRTYRCSDNSLFYVEFYNNNTALIRTSAGGHADHPDRGRAATRPTPPTAIR